jgi:hypothetical protein
MNTLRVALKDTIVKCAIPMTFTLLWMQCNKRALVLNFSQCFIIFIIASPLTCHTAVKFCLELMSAVSLIPFINENAPFIH